MAVNYDFYKTGGALAKGKEKWHVRVVENDTTRSEEMTAAIEEATSLTVADMKAALEAMKQFVARQLKSGRRVRIEGLGYLSLAMDGEVVRDKENRLRLKNPHVRTVKFQPEAELMHLLHNTDFTSQYHRGRTSANLDEEALHEAARLLTERKGFFTFKEFCAETALTRSTARRRLNKLQDEGHVGNIGRPNVGLYRYTAE